MKKYEELWLVSTLLIGVAVVAMVCGMFIGSRIVPKAYTFQYPVTPALAPVPAELEP